MTIALKLRESDEIQGDILAGFKKDNVTLLFLNFKDRVKARNWLKNLTPKIATTRQVAAFNAAFSAARRTSGGDDPVSLKAVWIGLSLTYQGLQTLSGKDPFPQGSSEGTARAFRQGPVAAANAIGDKEQSAPRNWIFGNGNRDVATDGNHTGSTDHRNEVVHAVLTIAADTARDLQTALSEQSQAAAEANVTIVFQQHGATLPGSARGKEHFGFKDGISEPGVAGFDEPDPVRKEWVKGKPGTRIIPADQFIIESKHKLPPWATNGSFQVVRRLAQDVPGWWVQVAAQLPILKKKKAVPQDATVEWLAARVVGRWRSGAPVALCPFTDVSFNPGSSWDNNFGFKDDPTGLTTPLFSHLRKTNPRDRLNEPEDVDNRRIIRRGIPYGQPFEPAADGASGPDAERGLVFVCYQADLEAQFEFIQVQWINEPKFLDNTGIDPLVGVKGEAFFQGTQAEDNGRVKLDFKQFVHTQGALYAFVPSLSTLRQLAEGVLTV